MPESKFSVGDRVFHLGSDGSIYGGTGVGTVVEVIEDKKRVGIKWSDGSKNYAGGQYSDDFSDTILLNKDWVFKIGALDVYYDKSLGHDAAMDFILDQILWCL